MKIFLLFALIFTIDLALGDWLATQICNGDQSLTLDAFIQNGDCTNLGIRAPSTYIYIQCTDNSYKTWYCDGNNCKDWAQKHSPVESGMLGICQNGQIRQCFKTFNETVVGKQLFPTAKRLGVAYSYGDWPSTLMCNGTVSTVVISWLDRCVPQAATTKHVMAQCDNKYLTEGRFSDAHCENPVGDVWQLPVQECDLGWYSTCFSQNT